MSDNTRNELQEALDILRKADSMELATDLEKSMGEQEDIIKAISAGSDALIDEVRAQNDALCKGLLKMASAAQTRDEQIATLTEMVSDLTETIESQMEGIQKSLNLPEGGMRAAGASADPEPTPAEQDAVPGVTVNESMAKAMGIVRNPATSQTQRQDITSLVSRLESGAINGDTFNKSINSLG